MSCLAWGHPLPLSVLPPSSPVATSEKKVDRVTGSSIGTLDSPDRRVGRNPAGGYQPRGAASTTPRSQEASGSSKEMRARSASNWFAASTPETPCSSMSSFWRVGSVSAAFTLAPAPVGRSNVCTDGPAKRPVTVATEVDGKTTSEIPDDLRNASVF